MSEIIRRPDFAGGGITPEEKIKMEAHTKMWIARAMRTEPIEPDKIIPAIKSLYAAAGLKEPRVIIVSSPLVMAFAGAFATAIWHMRKEGKVVQTGLLPSIECTSVRVRSFFAVQKAVDSEIFVGVKDISNAVPQLHIHETPTPPSENWPYELAMEIFGNHDDAMFALRTANRWWEMYQGGNMWAAWDCYLTAARDILGLKLKEHKKYATWEQCAIHGGFRFMHDEFCMVSDFPDILKKDDQNRPHSENGPSHRWRDGWALYHWHGVAVPGEWLMGKPPTAAEALKWPNIEQRRAACEIIGWAAILAQLNAKTINSHEDPEIGILLEVDLPDAGKERFLKVRCATGRDFCLPVPREMKSAIQANAWTFGFDTDAAGKYKEPIKLAGGLSLTHFQPDVCT